MPVATLYVDRKDIELRHVAGAIEVREPAGCRGSVPVAGLTRVVLHGRVQLDTSVIGALARAGVSVALIGGRHPRYLASCVGKAHNDVQRRLGQFDAYRDDAARLAWAGELVTAKVSAQRRLLRKAIEARPDQRYPLFRGERRLEGALDRLSEGGEPPSIPTLLGIEGAAAAAYFAAYAALFPPALGFRARRRRPPTDPVNACLSLAYTLLHFEAVSETHAAGLDPMLGLYHEPVYGRESFAADAIEPFRPHVDEWVWQMFRRRVFAERSFRREGRSVVLNKQARARFYEHYNPLAEALRRLLRRQLRRTARQFEQRARTAEDHRDHASANASPPH